MSMGTHISQTYGRTTISVRTAAPAVRALSIAGGTAKVLTAATVVPGGNRCGLGGARLSGRVVATRQASGSAVTLSRSTPSVLRTTRPTVDCAVGVAEQVAVRRATLAVLRVLGLPLLWDDAKVRSGDLGVVALDISDTAAAVAVLSGQTAVGLGGIAGGVNPAEVDIG